MEEAFLVGIIAAMLAFGILFCSIMFLLYLDKRKYNHGICKRCGSKMRYYDMDSSGAYGFTCDKCGNDIWVHYKE